RSGNSRIPQPWRKAAAGRRSRRRSGPGDQRGTDGQPQSGPSVPWRLVAADLVMGIVSCYRAANGCLRPPAGTTFAKAESVVAGRSVAIVCQVRPRSWRPSATARNSGSVKVVKPAYTLLIF